MQMAGEQRIAASRQRVWEALNDPEVLKACIPGCQSLEREGDDGFNAVAEVKIGPIGARFKGKVKLTDIDAPNGYTINGQGNGGVAGNAKGAAKVRLSDDGGVTVVSYEVDAEVGGRMAQLGGPIIDATAKNLAGKFFTTFGEVVGGETTGDEGQAAPATQAEPAQQASSTAPAAGVFGGARAETVSPASVQGGGSPWGLVFTIALAILAGFLLGRSTVADWWVIAVMVVVAVSTAAGFEAGRRSGGRS
ncbi:MAG: carbon monoxide dehydrogenase subunit G [Novosphingobium sp.]|nr:carbon monoxide dehydrogenase subunit G [Novosphingobium sp.]